MSARATDPELIILKAKPHDMEECLKVVMEIESSVVNRFIQGYKDKSENPPKILTTWYSPSKSLFINSLDSHVSKTGITSSRKAFQLSQP
jgi:hypothetical protein